MIKKANKVLTKLVPKLSKAIRSIPGVSNSWTNPNKPKSFAPSAGNQPKAGNKTPNKPPKTGTTNKAINKYGLLRTKRVNRVLAIIIIVLHNGLATVL